MNEQEDDDPYGLMGDIADDAKYDAAFEEIRDERGAEIHDQIDRDAILDAAAHEHGQLWEATSAALSKARERLDQGEYEEAIFHSGRAFDGYVQKVLARPVREQLMERIARAIPPFVKASENDVLVQMRGAGKAAIFAMALLSELLQGEADRADTLDSLNSFIKGGAGSGWGTRNELFHAPGSTTQDAANKFVRSVGDLIDRIRRHLQERYLRIVQAEQARPLTPARVYALERLAIYFDRANAWRDVFEIVDEGSPSGVEGALWHLGAEGFVESREIDVFHRAWRLTLEGEKHLREEVRPRL